METITFDTQLLKGMSRKELTSLAKLTGACKANVKSEAIIKALIKYVSEANIKPWVCYVEREHVCVRKC